MKRRQFLSATAAAPAFLEGQSARPNILFLLGDDHRWDAMGCAGNPLVHTPNLDRLAANGVMFSRNFVTTSICVSSRASILTGLYARSHGIWEFRDEFPREKWAESYPMLLRKAGYRTGFIGKFGIDGGKAPAEDFDYWKGFQGQGKYFPDNDGKTHLTNVMGDQMTEFLRGQKPGQPFCLSMSFKAPHVQDEDPRQFLTDPRDDALYKGVEFPIPQTAHPRYIAQLPLSVQRSEGRRRWAALFSTPELFQRSVRGYYSLITGVDRQVGRAVEELRKLGLADNTVIVYTGDNGFYLGEHGLAHKWFMHEESIRTPLIVYDPRLPRDKRDRKAGQMTLNIDCAPTMLELAGVRKPVGMQGWSFAGAVRGEAGGGRGEFFYEHHFRNNGWIPSTEGVRTDRWKYTAYIDEAERVEELYDLEVDMWEETNLVGNSRGRTELDMLRGRLAAWLKQLDAWRPGVAWTEPK